MRTHSFDSQRAVGLGLAALSALVAITCAAGGPVQGPRLRPPRAAAAASGDEAEASAAATATASAELPPLSSGTVAAEPTPPEADPQLARFHAALSRLQAGDKSRAVRVAWLGDSHTYADFWTHAVRSALQRRFGNGGPGYLLVGVHPYRSGRAKITVDGKWRREPSSPSSGAHQLDGVFGLLGMRAAPESADAKCVIEPYSSALVGGAQWTLLFRAKPGDRFLAKVGSDKPVTVSATSGKALAGSPIRRLALEGGSRDSFEVSAQAGQPEMFGVIVESKQPGVVVDNLGINGARASTVLAWQEGPWEAELGARSPELVVLAYGTNEAASKLTAARFSGHEKALMERVRRAVPKADCLMIGPTDMATPEGGSRPRVAELDGALESTARDVGCAFFSAYRAMGGEGGFAKWAKESPPLGSPDRIHLTPKGYEVLGDKTVKRLLRGFKAK